MQGQTSAPASEVSRLFPDCLLFCELALLLGFSLKLVENDRVAAFLRHEKTKLFWCWCPQHRGNSVTCGSDEN